MFCTWVLGWGVLWELSEEILSGLACCGPTEGEQRELGLPYKPCYCCWEAAVIGTDLEPRVIVQPLPLTHWDPWPAQAASLSLSLPAFGHLGTDPVQSALMSSPPHPSQCCLASLISAGQALSVRALQR